MCRIKAPKPAPVQAAPERTDADVQVVAEAARQRARGRRGQATTMLTGGQGVTGPTPTAVNMLLGGG